MLTFLALQALGILVVVGTFSRDILAFKSTDVTNDAYSDMYTTLAVQALAILVVAGTSSRDIVFNWCFEPCQPQGLHQGFPGV